MNQTTDYFQQAYIEAIYFTNGGPDNPGFDDAELSPSAMEAVARDCTAFEAAAKAELYDACGRYGYSTQIAGHDFWLTRNGHGAGFLDHDVLTHNQDGEDDALAERLTALAKATGPRDAYVGDDGLICLS